MLPSNEKKDNYLRYVVGWATGLFTFVVYNLTRAPTLSFWDCGEFIACASILGVPHPPGTPLYVLLGRLFTLFPTSADIAARVTLISTISSAGAAMLAFFVLYRILRGRLGDLRSAAWKKPVAYVGAITGALFMSFSTTHWNNAVEAEVYGASMFVIMGIMWLALRWYDNRQTMKGNRYLIAISYVAFASIGLHLTAFMVVPSALLFIVLADKQLRTDWRFWLTGVVLFTISFSFELFGISWLIWFTVAAIAVFVARRRKAWVLILLLLVAGAVGYTNHLFIPIRSAQDPAIDENNPETFESFRYFLGRKQYGSENMITRMFHRRGKLANQFGDHARMGFWRFFKTQYGFTGVLFIPVFALGIFGCLWLWIRHKNFGVLLVSMLILGSIGLVLYMNFADGARFNQLTGDAYIEVRDRDYFFTPGYTFFGLMMGVGLAGLLEMFFRRRKTVTTGRVAWISLVLLLLPLYQLQANYASCDRSRDFVPWDYAYNLLNFCEQDAILFTSGDNDTFPVWCLQESYGVRKDVSVVNLSLANTDWYILQMRDRYKLIDSSVADDQIKWSVPETFRGRDGKTHILPRPAEKYYDPVSGTREYLFPRQNPLTGGTLRTQDMVVELILTNNRWRRPVYFSGSVAGKSRFELEKHALQRGILYQVVPQEVTDPYDVDVNAVLFGDTCRYRGTDDLTIFRNESTTGNLMIYPEKFLQIADGYLRRGDTTKALTWAHKAAVTFPQYWRGPLVLADYLSMQGNTAAADSVLAVSEENLRLLVEFNPENRFAHLAYGMLIDRLERPEETLASLEKAFYLNPTDYLTFQPLILHAQRHRLNDVAVKAARKWLEYYPGDELARQIVAYGGVS